MASLQDISQRMASARTSMQISHTMEMVSTSKIWRALERAEQATPYKEAMVRMLANVASSASVQEEPLLMRHPYEQHVLFVLIASDRGLAGSFNMLLQRKVEREIARLKRNKVACSLITCGRKPTEYFTHRNMAPVMSFVGISSEPTIDEADRIAHYVMEGYRSNNIDRVMLYYNHAKNRVEQEAVIEQLLPICKQDLMMVNNPRTADAISNIEHELHTEYRFYPSATEVLSKLIPAYVSTLVYHALLDSAAAEHAARRSAMQSATENAQELIASLNHHYNRIRQGSITTELNEIVGSASALEDS